MCVERLMGTRGFYSLLHGRLVQFFILSHELSMPALTSPDLRHGQGKGGTFYFIRTIMEVMWMVKSVLFSSYLTGPWCPPLGLYHTTRGTPDFSTTFPPERSIRRSSSVDSGLWSVVSRRDRHLQSGRLEEYECRNF